jgi:hypothetical protein
MPEERIRDVVIRGTRAINFHWRKSIMNYHTVSYYVEDGFDHHMLSPQECRGDAPGSQKVK